LHNVAGGHGSSFDGGLTFTNGYQPLFLWLLALIFALGAGKAIAIHLGLALLAGAAAGAATAAYRLLTAKGNPWGGRAGGRPYQRQSVPCPADPDRV
jgi:hypothetical protein